MTESLKNKTVKGVSWSFIDNLSSSGITFLVGLVLARLLTPSEYGIMAILTIFIAVSNSIVDSGFSNALIRKTDARRVDYNTVFLFNLLISGLLYVVLFLAAPAISRFFKEPLLVEVMRVIGWVLVINALAIIPRTLFVKEVNFKTQTKVSLIASISSGVIGIGMALAGLGVWSLVGQQLSRQLLNTLFLWIYCTWRPAWEFSMQSFKELFGFGSKLLLSGLLDTVFKEIYSLVIGRCYTSAQLGQYTRASQFNQIFSSNLTSVIQRVSYPVLSSIQNEPERLREAYRKVIKSTMLISFACAGIGCRGQAFDSYLDRREMVACRRFSANHLFQWHAFSLARHQPEHPTGERAFGFISSLGNHQEDNCRRPASLGCAV